MPDELLSKVRSSLWFGRNFHPAIGQRGVVHRSYRVLNVSVRELSAEEEHTMKFAKYHALGNDYLVIDPDWFKGAVPTKEQIKRICHRHYGVGSDGILVGPGETAHHGFSLRIFNPDGSEAEKSGNGIRIFARYLWDSGIVKDEPFVILTAGGPVTSHVHEKGQSVSVEMGIVSFDSTRIPVAGPPREVLNETITLLGKNLTYCSATIGNPHTVILCSDVSEDMARQFGPLIEADKRFPNRTNVQFMKILSRESIQIEIWERGVGYTLASGSSSSAAAAVAYRLNLCGSHVRVLMPGGAIEVTIGRDFSALMKGPVTRICEGTLFEEAFI
jgi:diaminopimelate epimerase